jgi:hypothetical protein
LKTLLKIGKGLRVTKIDTNQFLPTGVQKSYFMLSRSTRAVLDTALRKYRPGRTDLIPVGGIDQLKPALRLMGLSSNWTENWVKPGRGSYFFLPRIFPPSTTFSPSVRSVPSGATCR